MKANIFHHIVAKWSVLKANSTKDAWERAIFQENWGVFNSLYLTNVSAKGVDGWSMLRAYDATPQAVAMLMERGANPHVQHTNNYNEHLIQRAAVQGDIDTVERLLNNGGNLDVRCFNEYDVLGAVVMGWGQRVAPLKQRTKMVQFLLQHGANARALQGTSQRSLLHNNDVDFEMSAQLLDAGAPLQWNTSYSEDNGRVVTQTMHFFHLIFNKPSYVLSPSDANRWLKLLKKHAALTDLTPEWNAGAPLSHAILAINSQPEDYIPIIEKYLGSLEQTNANKDNIWHTLFTQPPYTINLHRSALMAHGNLKHLLHEPNSQGVYPRDVLKASMQNPNVSSDVFNAVEDIDRELFQRPALLDIVSDTLDTKPARKSKL